MIPALLTRTLRVGNSAAILAAKAGMASRSSMSSTAERMPGLAVVVSSRAPGLRPATITRLPFAWKASASARPMPEPPPVIRIVLPEMFIWESPREVTMIAFDLFGGHSFRRPPRWPNKGFFA